MNRKSQNSFLVLTTLGVYLGLLMVGGAAAHAQTPEAVIGGTLDRKYPCSLDGLIFDERPENVNPLGYDLAKRFVELGKATLVRLEIVNSLEPNERHQFPFFFRQVDFSPYIDQNGTAQKNEWDSESSEWASASHAGQMAELDSIFLTPLADCKGRDSQKTVQTSAEFTMDSSVVGLELVIRKADKKRALYLASFLDNHLKEKGKGQSDMTVYSYLSVSPQDKQVVITVRMRREEFDSMLARL